LDELIEEVFAWARTKINFGNISNRLAAQRLNGLAASPIRDRPSRQWTPG
jgi:hypothetical protein